MFVSPLFACYLDNHKYLFAQTMFILLNEIVLIICFETPLASGLRTQPKIESLRGICIAAQMQSTQMIMLKNFAKCPKYFRMEKRCKLFPLKKILLRNLFSFMFISLLSNWRSACMHVNEEILNFSCVSISDVYLWQACVFFVKISQKMTETVTLDKLQLQFS